MKNVAKYPLFAALLGLSLTACQKQADPQPQPAAPQTQVTADANGESVLRVGETLTAGQSLVSGGDGAFRLIQRNDGDLVLIQIATNQVFWRTGTQGNSGARTTLRSDGSLVVLSRSNAVLYRSPAKGQGTHTLRLVSTSGDVRLEVQSSTSPIYRIFYKRLGFVAEPSN
ncbi:hypothetical protein [Hymenobacter terrenus]|uniref:hypothetical protein n=1 Tax=Hymenobacter terrenus TaxID=1629124 RepID=UPI000907FB17|nr:hypothetical protein [Hymenobacter terrenus]